MQFESLVFDNQNKLKVNYFFQINEDILLQ